MTADPNEQPLRTVAAVWRPCATCALVDVLSMPDTNPATVECRECIEDAVRESVRIEQGLQ